MTDQAGTVIGGSHERSVTMHSAFVKRLQVRQVIEPTVENQLGRCAIESDDHDAAARTIGRRTRSLGRNFIGRLTGEKAFQHDGVSRLKLADAAPMDTQRKRPRSISPNNLRKVQTGPAVFNQQNSDYARLTDPLARRSGDRPTPSTPLAPSHIRFLAETKASPPAPPLCETARAAHE